MHSSATYDIFTVIDKDLTMLLLENDVDNFNNMLNLKQKLTRKELQPRYRKPENRHESIYGW